MKVGILGAGQLAQMLAKAGSNLGMDFQFLCPDAASCAADYGQLMCKEYDDESAHQALIDWADVITYEFENIPNDMVSKLEKSSTLYPPSGALATAGDRINEKTMFNGLGINTAQYAAINSLADLQAAVLTIGVPSILKTRSDGYDGKGQRVIRHDTDLAQAWEQLNGVPCILESMVEFDREVSIIAARDAQGNMVCYPLTENHHREGILRLSLCLQAEPLQGKAQAMVKKIAEHLNYVGVIALELFQSGDELLANEIAPRVHNSGHWTQDGTQASQFENHLRAVCGLPLVQPTLSAPTAMVNVIGVRPDEQAVARHPNAISHMYGKSERPGRKIGHINVTASDQNVLSAELSSLLNLMGEKPLADVVSAALSSS